MKDASKLIAGPYKHEFGHELFSFQSTVRALAKNYEEVVVCSNPQMKFLYEDFCTEFVSYNDPSVDLAALSKGSDCEIFSQKDCMKNVRKFRGTSRARQEFIKYGRVVSEGYDLLLHCRTKSEGMSTDLSIKTWNCVYEALKEEYKIAFVGTKSQAHCPNGAKDLRGIELSDLTDIMRSSKLVAGYSSGPIHLASLCGAPHLTWGGHRLRTLFRYAHFWNPFKTPCYIFESPSENPGYLQRRACLWGAPPDIFDRKYVTLIKDKNYRVPTVNNLLCAIRKILNG